jgi:ADP-ribose pyrophosphatase
MSDQHRPKWTRLSKETVLANPWFRISHDRYVLPDGSVGDYHYVDIDGASMVVPLLSGDELVLVRQYRYLFRRWSLELPAGGVKQGAGFLETAREELQQEAGYRAAHLERIGEFSPYNGASNEMCRVYVGTGLTRAPLSPETTEEIEVLTLPLAEVRARVARSEIWDGMTIASLHLFESWLGGR